MTSWPIVVLLLLVGPSTGSTRDWGSAPTSLMLWADAVSSSELDPAATLRRCSGLLRLRHPSGAIGSSSGEFLVYESCLARAALGAVRQRIASPAIDRHLRDLERFIDAELKKELPSEDPMDREIDSTLERLSQDDPSTQRARDFFSRARISRTRAWLPSTWRQRLPPFLATPLTRDDPRVARWIDRFRQDNDLDRPEAIALHFADPPVIREAAPELFALACLARVLHVSEVEDLESTDGTTRNWRVEVRLRVDRLRQPDGTWGVGAPTNEVATALARLTLAWTGPRNPPPERPGRD
ncbi:MAG: hypothetical protein AB7O52_19455 [Planctomycetota bacterium]